MKGVDFEIDQLSLQNFAGGSTQRPSSVNYSWNKKQFNRRLVVCSRVLHILQAKYEKLFFINEEAALCSFFYICTPPAHNLFTLF